MFDVSQPTQSTASLTRFALVFPSGDTDPDHPFALTLSRRAPADLMSGHTAPLVLARFATLADAMQGDRPYRGNRLGRRAPASGNP